MVENIKLNKKPTKREKLQAANQESKSNKTKKSNIITNKKVGINPKVLILFKMFIFAAVLVIVFYPPYVRGLFFESEQFPAEIYTFIVFVIFWIYKYLKKDNRFLETPIDYGSFGFVLVYLVSIAVSVSTRMAISEWLKYCMFFAVLIMLSELADSYSLKLSVLWTMVVSASGVSIIGIDGASGEHIVAMLNKTFEILGINTRFFGIYVGNRINSTLQYPNALAAYLMAVFAVAFGLMLIVKKPLTRCIAIVPAFIIMATFIFSYSRGAYLIFPIMALLFFIFAPRGSRTKILFYGLALFVPLTYVAFKLFNVMGSGGGDAKTVWLPIIIGLCTSIIMTLGFSFVVKWIEIGLEYIRNWIVNSNKKVKVILSVSVGSFILMAVVAITLFLSIIMNKSVAVTLGDPTLKVNAIQSVSKAAVLKPGEYTLGYSLQKPSTVGESDLYSVVINSKSTKDVVGSKSGETLLDIEKGSSENSNRSELNFTVPQGSIALSIQFSSKLNAYAGALNDVVITNKNTGENVKNIIFKYKYIPDRIVSMYESSLSSLDFVSRNIFYKDALNIVKDHWLIGAGGGAWTLLYQSYQSYFYSSSQTHNYYLQLAVECGIVGLIILILLLMSITIMFFRKYSYKNSDNNNERLMQVALFSGLAALLMHSAIDFDLSLSCVFLLLWEFIALLNSQYRNNSIDEQYERKIYKNEYLNKTYEKLDNLVKVKRLTAMPLIVIILTIIIIIFPILFNSSLSYENLARTALTKNDKSAAIEYFDKAISSDKFNLSNKTEYANLILNKKDRTQAELEKADGYIREAEKVSYYNAQTQISIGSYYLAVGDIDKGLRNFERANELRPLLPEQWQTSLDVYSKVAMYYYQNKDMQNFIKYADGAIKLEDKAKEVNKKNLNPFIFNTETFKILEHLTYIKAALESKMNIDSNSLVFFNLPQIDIDSNGIPDQWSVIGDEKVKFIINKDKMSVEAVKPGSQSFIQSRGLNLEENKNYIIQVELENSSDIKSIPFSLTANGGLTEILKPEGNIFSAKVTVNKLTEKDAYALKLAVYGRYDIKDITILQVQ